MQVSGLVSSTDCCKLHRPSVRASIQLVGGWLVCAAATNSEKNVLLQSDQITFFAHTLANC